MQRTRRQILDCIKLKGPKSVDLLGEELGVMPVTIRAHISMLEKDQLLEGTEHRTGRAGRPSIVYSLTEKAQEHFPNSYDNLAANILDKVKKLHGEKTVMQVVEKIGEDMAEVHAYRIEGMDMDGKVEEVTQVMNQEGSLATWEKQENKYVLIAHNCPYLHVAEQRKEICNMETAFLKKALSSNVKLVHSVVGGSQNCVFDISNR